MMNRYIAPIIMRQLRHGLASGCEDSRFSSINLAEEGDQGGSI